MSPFIFPLLFQTAAKQINLALDILHVQVNGFPLPSFPFFSNLKIGLNSSFEDRFE